MYCCKACGGRNVESLSWVDLNTGEVEEGADDVGEFYCRDCNSHTDVDYKESLFESDLADDVSVHKLDKPENEFKV